MKKMPLILSLLALVSNQCKIDTYNLDSTDPIFRVEGTFDASTYRFTAGLDSIYHFTNNTSKNAEIDLQSGKFANQDCASSVAPCSGILEFIFSDRIANANVLSAGNFPYLSDSVYTGVVFPVTIAPINPDNLSTWTVRTTYGGSENLPMPAQINLLSDTPTNIMVFGQAKSGIKYQNTTTYNPANPDKCQPVYISFQIDNGIATAKAETLMDADAGSYVWSSGITGPENQFSHDFSNSYAVTVTSTDGQCTASSQLGNIPDISGLTYEAPQYAVASQGAVEHAFQEGFSIIWVDANGVEYSSASVPQDGQSYFTVTHIEPYQRNENGIPTNFLEVSYKCFVKPLTVESNQPVLLTGKGTIALGSQ